MKTILSEDVVSLVLKAIAGFLGLLPVHEAVPAGGAPPVIDMTIDGASGGRTFDGVGALSAGASSRLLVDYPEPQRSEILDYLFKPNYGASLHILKVEIGGDTNSTDGAEPSHMRSRTDRSYDRGYEWWLMQEAKKRNPNITLAALEWGAPGWFRGDNGKSIDYDKFWSQDNIDYILAWLDGAKSHGLHIDYVGGWNEKGFDKGWYQRLKRALLSGGYADVAIVGDDSFSWTVADAMAADPAFAESIDVVGNHYPNTTIDGFLASPSSSAARQSGKRLWASEQGSNAYDAGAGKLAREINRAYIDGAMTATINWSLINSWYEGLPYPKDGLMQANQPWSGAYTVGQSIWAVAHTTQFTQPGWRYLDSACGFLGNERAHGSYVTLRAPAANDYTMVVETLDATAARPITWKVTGGLSTGAVHVWSSELGASDPSRWFVEDSVVEPHDGTYTVVLEPGRVYTLTTTEGQEKGAAIPPSPGVLGLPYHDDFQSYASGSTPRYFSDLQGAFETAPAQGRSGLALRQVITENPVRWDDFADYPSTLIGDPLAWRDYQVETDAYLEQAGSEIEVVGRARAPGTWINGYHFQITDTGTWKLYRADPSGANTTLASGTSSFGVRQWHRVGMILRGNQIVALLDGKALATVHDPTYRTGQVALVVYPYAHAELGNFDVVEAAPKGSELVIEKADPDPVILRTQGGSATMTATVRNPGPAAAQGVGLRLDVPSGWTARPVSTGKRTLSPGECTQWSWRLVPDAAVVPDRYRGTITLDYQSVDQAGPLIRSVGIAYRIIPHDQMTARASSAQDNYEASKAIDDDLATMWHTSWNPYAAPPQSLTLAFDGAHTMTGFIYRPRIDGNLNGVITQYTLSTSRDGTSFTPIASGTWPADASEKRVTFPAVRAPIVRLTATEGHNGYVSAAEVNVIGDPRP